MGWRHLKIFWHGEDKSAVASVRKKKKQNTGRNQWEDNIDIEVLRFSLGSGRQGKCGKIQFNIISGASTTVKIKDMRRDKIKRSR